MGRDRVGVALIGAGFIAQYHLAGLKAAGGADVRAIAGRSAEKAARLAREFGAGEGTDDWRRVLDRADVHAVIIATPDHTHEPIAVAAADAGKAMLVQKPMAGSVAACRRIIAAARLAGVDLQVSFMHRYFEEVQWARQALADGLIGRVHSLRVRNATPGPDWGDWFFDSSNVANGVVDQLGVHGIDLALRLIGPIHDVSARVATLLEQRRLADGREVHVRAPDTAFATYGFDGGVLGTHEMSMIEQQGCDRFRIEIYGSEGTLWLRTERGRLAVWAPAQFGQQWHIPSFEDAPLGQRHHAHWLAGLNGSACPAHTASEALVGMQVVEAIRRSAARDGGQVPVENEDRLPVDDGGQDLVRDGSVGEADHG